VRKNEIVGFDIPARLSATNVGGFFKNKNHDFAWRIFLCVEIDIRIVLHLIASMLSNVCLCGCV
jgi:hypothetical protein